MAELYYTNVSERQARLIFAYSQAKALNISDAMARYIMSIARQGRGYAIDPHEEEFRRTVVKCVDQLMKSRREMVGTRNLPEKKTMDEVAKTLTDSFRKLCSFRSSYYLDKVKDDLDTMDSEK